jgi:hypothetical protein
MIILLNTLRWLKDYWYVPAILVLGIVGTVLWRRFGGRGEDPMLRVNAELRAIEAGREVRQVRLEQGLQGAQAAVAAKYASKINELDDAEADRVSQLRHDPEAMARAIERLTR